MSDLPYEFAPQYDFGNKSEMAVRDLAWNPGEMIVDPQALHLQIPEERYVDGRNVKVDSAEWQFSCEGRLAEIRDNWQLVTDPEEGSNTILEATVVNEHALNEENSPVLVRISDSTIPEDPSEALRLADYALANPDMMIIHIARPGVGASTGLSDGELERAREDGRLIGLNSSVWDAENKKFVAGTFDSYPSVKAMARIIHKIKGTRGRITHLCADNIGAHYAAALMSDIPEGDLQRAFFFDPTNISDIYGRVTNSLRQIPGQIHAEGFTRSYASRLAQEKYEGKIYARYSTDPLAMIPERLQRVERVFDEDFHARVAEERSRARATYMPGEKQIYRNGMKRGNAAAYHLISGLAIHPGAKVSYGISELAAHYESKLDISAFMELAYAIGRETVSTMDVECYELPVGGEWERYHPQARMALMDRAFHR